MAVGKTGGVSSFTPIKFELDNIQNNESSTASFGDYLKAALDNVGNLELDAQKVADDFASGATDNIQDVLIAGEKADIALQLTMQVRNKILDAYNEIMRMQI